MSKDSAQYYPQSPVDAAYFVGRKDILDATAKIMEGSRADQINDIEIIGRRGMGKTSTLLKIKSISSPDNLIVYVPGRICDPIEFVDELLQAIEREFRFSFNKTISFIDQAAALRRGEKSGISTLIDAISGLADFRMFILLDDADMISPEALVILKSATSQLRLIHGIRVGLIFGSEDSVSKNILKGGLSPAESFVFSFKLRNFTLEEVAAILAGSYSKWTEKSVRHVFSKSKGYPTLVQMYGAAYYKLAESDGIMKMIDIEIPKPKEPTRESGWFGVLSNIAYIGIEASKIATFEQISDKIALKCDKSVEDSLLKWYIDSWTKKPSKAEWRVALAVARLGYSAKFNDIKRVYGRNPAPQLKRAVEKKVLEHHSRGVYAIPHPLITKVLREKYVSKKS